MNSFWFKQAFLGGVADSNGGIQPWLQEDQWRKVYGLIQLARCLPCGFFIYQPLRSC